MRPFTSDRAGMAICVLFLAVAAFLSWIADSSFGFGPDQIAYNLVAEELLTAWDHGSTLESEFGSVYRQSFAFFHAAGRRLLGDAEASYRLILFLSACGYLLTMYVLLVYVLQDRKIAALTTVLSIVQRYTIGTSFWGMGEYQSILPRIVVLAVFPLAWLLFERNLRSNRVLQAFMLTACGFALHLSAVYFYCILLMTYALYVLSSRIRSSMFNVALAATFFLFAIRAVPSPVWSHVIEETPLLAVPAVLIGVCLVLYFSTLARGRLAGVVTILYLITCFSWLMGEGSLRGILGVENNELHELKLDSVSVASNQIHPTGDTGEMAGLGEAAKGSSDKSTGTPGESAGTPTPGGEATGTPGEATGTTGTPGEATGTTGEAADTSADVASERDNLAALNRAIYARFGWTLFPISMATLGFALYNGGILGAVALYEFVRRWKQGATEREHIAGLFVVSVIVVSLGITGAVQLYCRLTGRPNIVLELFRALRFLYLPMYIYLGLFLQRLWRQEPVQDNLWKRLLLGVMILILIISPRQALAALPDSVKLFVRSTLENSRSLNGGDPSQRKYLYLLLATDVEIASARDRHRDFLDLCEWVKTSTPKDSIFMTTDYSFIHHCGRNIMISYAQGAGSARSMAMVTGYQAWHDAYIAISEAFESRSPDQIMAVAHRYEVDYVVVSGDLGRLPALAVYSNSSFTLYKLTN